MSNKHSIKHPHKSWLQEQDVSVCISQWLTISSSHAQHYTEGSVGKKLRQCLDVWDFTYVHLRESGTMDFVVRLALQYIYKFE